MNIPENCLWEDLKHIGPFEYPLTKYYLTKDIIYSVEGFLSISNNQVSLNRVSTVKLNINFFQRIFGIGTLEIFAIGDSNISLKLEGIKKPKEVQSLIMELLK